MGLTQNSCGEEFSRESGGQGVTLETLSAIESIFPSLGSPFFRAISLWLVKKLTT